MALTLQCSTELEAVNTMLQTIGSSPVNTLEGNGVVDAVMARQTLHNVSRDMQEQGWAFNTEKDWEVSPDTSGELQLPPNCLRVDPVDFEELDLVQRGSRLYDRKNHTYTVGRSVKVEMIVMLEWDELPQVARRFFTIKAARIFQDGVVGSDTLNGFTAKDELRAQVAMRNAEANNSDNNMLTGSVVTARIIARNTVWR